MRCKLFNPLSVDPKNSSGVNTEQIHNAKVTPCDNHCPNQETSSYVRQPFPKTGIILPG